MTSGKPPTLQLAGRSQLICVVLAACVLMLLYVWLWPAEHRRNSANPGRTDRSDCEFGDNAVVVGRVTNGDGKGVGKVTVWLNGWSIPRTQESSGLSIRSTTSGPSGCYEFTIGRDDTALEGESLIKVWAEGGSLTTIQRVGEFPVEPPLVLEPLELEQAVIPIVQVVHPDGQVPIPGLLVEVNLHEPSVTGADDHAALYRLAGHTNSSGIAILPPVPRRAYAASRIRLSGHNTPRQTFHNLPVEWKGTRLMFRVEAQPGRSVRGSLAMADGRPATGFGIAPVSSDGSDPRPGDWVSVGQSGDFLIPCCAQDVSRLVVASRAAAGPVSSFKSALPLLFVKLRLGLSSEDVGHISLPALRTVRVMFARRGQSIASGWVSLRRPDARHPVVMQQILGRVTEFRDLPSDSVIAVGYHEALDADERGAVQEFELPASSEDETFRFKLR